MAFRRTSFLLFALAWLLPDPARAQHPHHPHATLPADSAAASPPTPTDHGEHRSTAQGTMARMQNAVAPTAPMTRDGSGTGWLPDASPMEAVHHGAGAWALMLHGTAFLRYTNQDAFDSGTRGGSALSAPNWLMAMAQRPVGTGGQLTLRAMLSLDPLTEGGDGYPLLFQTGESFEGAPLIDRQHPHELFSEVSATFAQRVGERATVFGHLAYPGEPALGPTAFMHRPSARHVPDSPLGHHWQDATHILFGVATAGVAVGPAKLDASLFTGREPDEARYGFDRPRFDSYSARLTLNPSARWSLQASSAFLESPELLEPGVDQVRTTASVLYSRPTASGAWTATLLWGLNVPRTEEGDHHHGGAQHAFLAESDLTRGRQAVFGRAEYVQKPAAELGLEGLPDEQYGVGALTLGTARAVLRLSSLDLMLGALGTAYAVPGDLRPVYGDAPVSFQVFLRLAPARMEHGG